MGSPPLLLFLVVLSLPFCGFLPGGQQFQQAIRDIGTHVGSVLGDGAELGKNVPHQYHRQNLLLFVQF